MATPTLQAVEIGIPVARPRDISLPCIRLLRELLADPYLEFAGLPLSAGGPGEIFLTSNSATSAFADRSYPVIVLLRKESLTYWLALALTFTRKRDFRMTSASMIVFEGVATNPTKTPLLRAEWHEWDSTSIHAQPHWHVYPSALTEFASFFPEAFTVVQRSVEEFEAEPRTEASARKCRNFTISLCHVRNVAR